jgi:hypothetical protein
LRELRSGLRLLHEAVKASNVLFNADWWIQIAEFNLIHLEMGAFEPFLEERLVPTVDVCTFVSLPFEIAIGRH